jgi:hypothetical protein
MISLYIYENLDTKMEEPYKGIREPYMGGNLVYNIMLDCDSAFENLENSSSSSKHHMHIMSGIKGPYQIRFPWPRDEPCSQARHADLIYTIKLHGYCYPKHDSNEAQNTVIDHPQLAKLRGLTAVTIGLDCIESEKKKYFNERAQRVERLKTQSPQPLTRPPS